MPSAVSGWNVKPPNARALADLLDRRAAELHRADEARALWYAHNAETRAAEQRARIELATRGVDPDRAEQATTARPMARRAPGRAGCRRRAPHVTDDASSTTSRRNAS